MVVEGVVVEEEEAREHFCLMPCGRLWVVVALQDWALVGKGYTYPKECEGQWGEWEAQHRHFHLDTWVGEGSRLDLPDLQGNPAVRQGSHPAVRRVQVPQPP